MAFNHGSKARALLNGFDVSAYLSSMAMAGSMETADVSVMGNTAKQFVTGLMAASITFDGKFDPAEDVVLAAAMSAGASYDELLYFPSGYGTIGNSVYGFEGFNTAYNIDTSVSDAAKWTGTLESTTGFERGALLHPYQAEVAGGNSTGFDQTTVSTTNGGVGFLNASAGATLIVKIQDSADNSAFADILTFSTLSAAGAQRSVIAGTVRRYVRCLWTGTGTFAASFVRR